MIGNDGSSLRPSPRARSSSASFLPTLERIDYDLASKLATKWHLSPLVVLDPRVCFGQPIVEPVGITTYVLAAFYIANGRNAKTVVNWYEIEEEHVMAAVEFETRFAA
jgi:uncharacterized protein (DUF433 family)